MKQKKKLLYNIRWRHLRFCVLLFLLLPTLIFLLGFVKLIYALPVSIATLVAFVFAVRSAHDETIITISRVGFFVLLFTSAIWCWLGGQGGLFYQTDDWNWRNAIFRDLIIREWPVYLPTIDAQLVYYIGYWMPAAAIGKLAYWATNNASMAWNIGNIALGVWTAACVFLVFLLLFGVVGAQTCLRKILAVAVMIGFSGLDIIGCVYYHWSLQEYLTILHIEWWASDIQFSSNTTCLFWVFNQAVPIWLAFMLFMREKNAMSYAFIIICTLISAPIPCVGLAVLMLGQAAIDCVYAVRHRGISIWLQQIFSVQNIIATCMVFPIIAAYFFSNLAIKSDSTSTKATLLRYLLFMTLECGIYYALLLPENLKKPMYYVSALFLMACPFIHIGTGSDFCMRASIPALLYLMTLVIKSLYAPYHAGGKRITKLLLVVCLVVGLATPCTEIFRGFYKATQANTLILPADNVETVDSYLSSGEVNANFVSTEYESSFFFTYLASK